MLLHSPYIHLAGKAADGGNAGCRVMFQLAQFLCGNGVRETFKFHVVLHLHGTG